MPTIAFCGLQRARGTVIPTCELQARWIAALYSGKSQLPSRRVMDRWLEAFWKVKSEDNPNTMLRDANPMVQMQEEIAEEVRGCIERACHRALLLHRNWH